METVTISPQKISVDKLLVWKDHAVIAPDGINIPNTTVPLNLVSKKRATEARDTITISVRQIFNSLTLDNIAKSKDKLKEIVCTKAQKNVEALAEVADEIFENFIVSDKNIKNYMHLLNSIWNGSILVQYPNKTNEGVKSPCIGSFFINKCKTMIFKYIDEKNIEKLASMDLENIDVLDEYNKARETIINLIITLCELYEQRDRPLIKLTAVQIYSVMKSILDSHANCQKKMKELGDPYDDTGECKDELLYETNRKMCSLYVEQLYYFLRQQGTNFVKDDTEVILVKDDTEVMDKGIGKQTLKALIIRFKQDIIPTLTEAHLKSRCRDLACWKYLDDESNK